jgi:bifunctional non-homologous end joining protein LigD
MSAVRKSFNTGLPRFVEPMKARVVARPPPGNWVYEIKFDGFRALGFKNGSAAALLSRNDKDLGGRFPRVLEAVRSLKIDDFILDGEIVALDHEGRSSFQLLQAHDMGQQQPPIIYYVFDLLRLEGENLQRCPLIERKERLEKALAQGSRLIRYSASLEGDVVELLTHAQKLGLEGLIGKRPDSIYEPGRRSQSWIKLKLVQEQEMVVGGFTDPEGSRPYFGSLVVGYYEKDQLLCAGKVGTGFNDAWLRSLSARFKSLSIATCPFKNLPESRAGRYGAGITAAEMRRCHWVKPVLVCQVKYSEWTRDGKLRHPVFLGMRDDKAAEEVVRERPMVEG